MATESRITSHAPLSLVCGDDDLAVKQRAKQIFNEWSAELGGMDHETIEATAANSGEALTILGKLREALLTLPFFGGGKVVWLRDCNFLNDDKTAKSAAVTETLGELAEELKTFQWQNVRLLISATKADKRKVFYKTVDKLGTAEEFAAWSMDDRDWADRAQIAARNALKVRSKEISREALMELMQRAGSSARQLENEVEKLCVSVGERAKVELADVTRICPLNKSARAFALGDALGDRNLPALLKCLDEELWEIRAKINKDKSEIGLLYGLTGKIRALLFLKEMMREGWIKESRDYNSFKAQLEKISPDKMPTDKKFNPLATNPYVLYKALPQVKKYSASELVNALEVLLRCNQKLVSSGLDEALVLQQALVQIITPATATA
ncbi:MAG: polymerase subunit delta [Verrucomicrobiota bacterium]|jgi:DNA polymerase-3 subunit delta